MQRTQKDAPLIFGVMPDNRQGEKEMEDPVFQSQLYHDAVSVWGGLSSSESDWLEKIQDALWESFEGHYLDFEDQPDEFLDKILRLRGKYSIKKVIQIIIRYVSFTNWLFESREVA